MSGWRISRGFRILQRLGVDNRRTIRTRHCPKAWCSHKTRLLWVLGSSVACIALCGAVWSQEAGKPPALLISVLNEAGVERGVLERAEARVGREFGASGIAVIWRNPAWGVASTRGNDSSSLSVPSEERCIYVHILPRARSAADEIFGVAFLDEDGGGQQTDLFYDRIARFGGHLPQDRSVLLSAVMTHELGHLLLGTRSHTATGMMQARWDNEVVRQLGQGLLGFSPEQGEQMRNKLGKLETLGVHMRFRQKRQNVNDEPGQIAGLR